MPIVDIIETINQKMPDMKPVHEVMEEFIPGVTIENIPNRNGVRWLICGAPGSGKTYLGLNFFKLKQLFRGKFDNIYYFCPLESITSVQDHPFKDHTHVYHEMTAENLNNIYNELIGMKETIMKNREKKNKKEEKIYDDENDNEKQEKEELDTDLK